MAGRDERKVKEGEETKKTSIDSLEALTDVEIDYPLVYRHDIDPLGGRNTTEERYPIRGMIDNE
ncbi:MAG: hypothetical protein ACM3TR_02700 [Caulobacteraceae bacterium]